MKTAIEMAKQVSAEGYAPVLLHPEVLRLCELVRAQEREACAKVCDDWPNGRDDVYSIGVAIRARSNT